MMPVLRRVARSSWSTTGPTIQRLERRRIRCMLVALMVVRGTSDRAGLRRRVALLALLCVALVCFAFSGSAFASSVPSIDSVSVSGITEHDAVLEAQIDPNGLETTYELYLSSPACQADWPAIGPCLVIEDFSVPGGSIPADTGDQTISLDLNSVGVNLQAGTWYEYSLSAANAAGRVPAERATQRDFKTLSPGQPISLPTGGSTGTLPGAIEPLPVNEQIEREFEEHPPWDHAPSGPPAEAPTAVVAKGDVPPKPKALTTTQKLAEALKACKREPKRKQGSCRRQAEKKYAAAGKVSRRHTA
jgi:hypothetical protein